MAAQQRRWHWDKRKKRYVQHMGADATAGQAATRVRTESGKMVESIRNKVGVGGNTSAGLPGAAACAYLLA
jgi:hypothetical protein